MPPSSVTRCCRARAALGCKCARAPRNASCAATDKASCSTNCCRGRRIGRRPWKTPEGWGCRKLCGLKPGPAASDYWRCCTLADMAADLYANGAAGAMMGGAGAAALGRLNRLPGLGRDVRADVAVLYRGIRNPFRQEGTSPGNIGNDIPNEEIGRASCRERV